MAERDIMKESKEYMGKLFEELEQRESKLAEQLHEVRMMKKKIKKFVGGKNDIGKFKVDKASSSRS